MDGIHIKMDRNWVSDEPDTDSDGSDPGSNGEDPDSDLTYPGPKLERKRIYPNFKLSIVQQEKKTIR